LGGEGPCKNGTGLEGHSFTIGERAPNQTGWQTHKPTRTNWTVKEKYTFWAQFTSHSKGNGYVSTQRIAKKNDTSRNRCKGHNIIKVYVVIGASRTTSEKSNARGKKVLNENQTPQEDKGNIWGNELLGIITPQLGRALKTQIGLFVGRSQTNFYETLGGDCIFNKQGAWGGVLLFVYRRKQGKDCGW